jgi:hypothetical protein
MSVWQFYRKEARDSVFLRNPERIQSPAVGVLQPQRRQPPLPSTRPVIYTYGLP